MASPLSTIWVVLLTLTTVVAPPSGASDAAMAAPTCAGRAATIVGTPGDDEIQGTTGDDVIVGRAGDDMIYGNGGDDVVCGGAGADVIETGDGADRILAGAGSDRVDGGPGRDVISGGKGRDVIIGGAGADVIRGKSGADILRGRKGDDIERGNRGRDQLTGGRGTDSTMGGGADDACDGEEASRCETGIRAGASAIDGDGDFGAVAVAEGAAKLRTFRVANDGGGHLEIRALSIRGADAAAFEVAEPWRLRVLLPGETRTVDVAFRPGRGGSHHATLEVTTNDPGARTRSLALTGIGVTGTSPPAAPLQLSAVAAGPDRVELVWVDASSDEDAFEIERRTPSGAFTALAEVAAGTTSYVDGSVMPDSVYTYRIRARKSTLYSGYSNEASVVTPAPPPPPPDFDLAIERVYLNQAVPVADSSDPPSSGPPPVARRAGLVRAFVTASGPNTSDPTVLLHWRRPSGASGVVTLAGPPSVPTTVGESSLAATYNSGFDAAFLEPGTEVFVEVDPDDVIAEVDEANNRYPAAGWLDLAVTTVPLFEITLVPVTYQGQTPVIDAQRARDLLDASLRMHPIADYDIEIRAPWTYTGDSWSDMLGRLANTRVADGSTDFYHGIVVDGPGTGIAGIGYIGYPVAVSIQDDVVVAHELGHNFDLHHAPCGNPAGPDPSYPYAGGGIGTWGYDTVAGALRDPAVYKDVMTYCGPEWISDYNYEKVLDYRVETAQARPAARHLVVSGTIDAAGEVAIDSVEEHVTPPVEAPSDGLRLVGYDARRRAVFAAPVRVLEWAAAGPAGEVTGKRFLATVPVNGFAPADVARIDVADTAGRRVASWFGPAGPN